MYVGMKALTFSSDIALEAEKKKRQRRQTRASGATKSKWLTVVFALALGIAFFICPGHHRAVRL